MSPLSVCRAIVPRVPCPGAVLGLLVFLLAPSVCAQELVAPGLKRTVIEIERGTDIVQAPTVLYKRVRDGDDPFSVRADTIGVLKVPRHIDLDAIHFIDARRGVSVNLQHAMIVSGREIADVELSREAMGWPVPPGAARVSQELLVIRPPAEDAFDVAVPTGLTCERLVPGSTAERLVRGTLSGSAPCKQVPGVETVIDLRAWLNASSDAVPIGPRSPDRPFANATELRGKLQSLAPGGERVRFVIVATPPPRMLIAAGAPTRLDTVLLSPVIRAHAGPVRVNTVATPNVEWTATIAALQGPNRSRLPAPAPRRYRANRIKGDASTTLRWKAGPGQHYEITAFGSTQVSLSDQSTGNHHAVPYGGSLAARFGKEGDTGVLLRAEGAYTDDPFQMTTLADGDQRLRLLAGVDVSSTLHRPFNWHLVAGPTYFVDRPGTLETRDDARQLGYSVDAGLTRTVRVLHIPAALTVRGQVFQSWGYVQDAGNTNLTLVGRLSTKPYVRLGRSTAAIGPVLYTDYAKSNYATAPGLRDANLQVGIEMTSQIRF